MMSPVVRFFCVCLIGDVLTTAACAAEARRPIAVAVTDDGASAWVACESGALVRLSLGRSRLVGRGQRLDATAPLQGVGDGTIAEQRTVGGRLTDFALDPQGAWWAAVDGDAQEVLFGSTGNTSAPPRRFKVAADPVACAASADGRRLAVTSRWTRTVTWFEFETLWNENTDNGQSLVLPFAPRKCLWLPDNRHLLVADAFAGKLAVIDTESAMLDSVREIPGHNIAALVLQPPGERLYLTQQMIHRGSQTSRDGVHWGGILTNAIRSLAVSDLMDPSADILAHNRTDYVGDIGRGAGDPSGIAVPADGSLIVAFAGVDEIAFDPGSGLDWKRITVGRRPTALALTPDGRRAVVANTFDDSVSIVSVVGSGRVEHTVPLAPPRELTAVKRGERLFYDARLSHDGWFSCHSCHTDGHSNRQLVDNFTDGTTGTPKRVLSLLGVRDTAPYAWDGHLADLTSQVKHSVVSTMQGAAINDAQAADLVAFLLTLRPPRAHSNASAEQIVSGRRVFHDQGCARCHAGEALTTTETYDVGLADEQGLRRFNPPSLRGVSQGGPYFHDGRIERLEDVLTKQRHELTAPPSAEDQAALLAFLESL